MKGVEFLITRSKFIKRQRDFLLLSKYLSFKTTISQSKPKLKEKKTINLIIL